MSNINNYINPCTAIRSTHDEFKKLTPAKQFGVVVLTMSVAATGTVVTAAATAAVILFTPIAVAAVVAAVAAATILSLATIIASTATCRGLVNHFKQITPKQNSPQGSTQSNVPPVAAQNTTGEGTPPPASTPELLHNLNHSSSDNCNGLANLPPSETASQQIDRSLYSSTPLFSKSTAPLDPMSQSLILNNKGPVDDSVWYVEANASEFIKNKFPNATDLTEEQITETCKELFKSVDLTKLTPVRVMEQKPVAECNEETIIPSEMMDSQMFTSAVMINTTTTAQMQANRNRLGLNAKSKFNILQLIRTFSSTETPTNPSLIGYGDGKLCIVHAAHNNFNDIFLHLLKETYGTGLSSKVEERLNINHTKTITWEDLQAALIVVATYVRENDLRDLYNQIKGSSCSSANPPAYLYCCDGILRTDDLEKIRTTNNFESLTQEQIEILLKPFRSVFLGTEPSPTTDLIANVRASYQPSSGLMFDNLIHDMDLLSTMSAYRAVKTDCMQSDPQSTRSEYLAKRIAYQEVKTGMIISLPVLNDQNEIEPRHYSVFGEIAHADGIMYNLMVPVTKPSSISETDTPEEIFLNFRGSGVSPDQACSGATWERNLDLRGVGKSVFDKHEKFLLSTVTQYLEKTSSNEVVLNVSGHSLGGCDVNRAMVSLTRHLANAIDISRCIEEINKFLEEFNTSQSADQTENSSKTINDAIKNLIPLMRNQSELIVNDGEQKMTETPINELENANHTDIKTKLEEAPLKNLLSRLKAWTKVKTINGTSHNSPRPELTLNDEFKQIIEQLNKSEPNIRINVNHIRFEDKGYEDVVQKCGDILVGADIKSKNFTVKITKVKIKHNFGLLGIIERHGFRAYCDNSNPTEYEIETLENRQAVNEILKNRWSWNVEEANAIKNAISTAGWYAGYVPRMVQNTAQTCIFALYSPTLHTIRYVVGGVHTVTDPICLGSSSSSSNGSSSSDDDSQ